MRVRNIDANGARIVPVGQVDITVEFGAVHDFPDNLGARLCEQVDVWQQVPDDKPISTKEAGS